MEIVPYESLVTGNQSSSHGGDDDGWKPYLEKCFLASHFPELYVKRKAIGGQMRVCIFCIETQHDHVSKNGKGGANLNTATMVRIQRVAQNRVEAIDDFNGDLRYRVQRQCKYAMHNNGDHGDHDKRKQVGIGTIRNLFLFCGADDLLAFLNETLANGHKIDDLCDAFSLMLETATELFAEAVKNRHEAVYTGNPLITGTSQLTLEDETSAVLAIDPGKNNFARCLGEVVGLDPRAKETYVTHKAEVKEHTVTRPYFCVHRWQLIDLVSGVVKADYKGPSKIYFRMDSPVRNVTAPATPGHVSSGLAPPPTKKRKRKRVDEPSVKKPRLGDTFFTKKKSAPIEIDLSEE